MAPLVVRSSRWSPATDWTAVSTLTNKLETIMTLTSTTIRPLVDLNESLLMWAESARG